MKGPTTPLQQTRAQFGCIVVAQMDEGQRSEGEHGDGMIPQSCTTRVEKLWRSRIPRLSVVQLSHAHQKPGAEPKPFPSSLRGDLSCSQPGRL